MKLNPDLRLPEEVQIHLDAETYHFIDECLPGIKYINIHKKLNRDRYELVMKMDLNKNPSPNQKPEDKIEVICTTLAAIIQYDIDARDEGGSYRLQCFRNSGTQKDHLKSKHIDVNLEDHSASLRDQSIHPFSEDNTNQDFVAVQLEYIKMLQDQNVKNQNVLSAFCASMIESQRHIQQMVTDMMTKSVDLERIRAQQLLHEQQNTIDAEIARLKEKSKSERWNKAMAVLDKSGGAKALMDAFAKKIMAGTGLPDEPVPNPVPNPIRRPPPPQNFSKQTSTQSNPPVHVIDQEEMDRIEKELEEQTQREIDYMIENEPLRCHIKILESKLEDELKEEIKEDLGEQIYERFINLMKSENEEMAVKNLIILKENMKPDDLSRIQNFYDKLDDKQKELVMKILSFDVA